MSTGINIAPSSDITVGTTAVTSGTDGRVFFQAGGVVQQDAAFFWDNTNKRLGVGATPSTSVRLDVRAQGALSTDIAFRVRNSADTDDILSVQGDTKIIHNINANTATTYQGFNVAGSNTDTYISATVSGNQPMQVGFRARSANAGNGVNIFADNGNVSGVGSASSHIWFNTTGYAYMGAISNNSLGFKFGFTSGSQLSNTAGMFAMIAKSSVSTNQSVFSIGTYLGTTTGAVSSTYGGNTFFIANGTAPTTTGTDAFGIYSADITAGNAAPHFRTEDGSIVKLYQETAVTTAQGIATALANQGLLATSTIVPTVQSVVSAATVTPVEGNEEVVITAQATDFTIANPTGTWYEGQDLIIRIKDDGTGRAITWDTNYRAIGVTLPTTTVANKLTYIGVIYNSTDGKWDVLGISQEA